MSTGNGTTKLVWWGMGVLGSFLVVGAMFWMTTMYNRLEAATISIGLVRENLAGRTASFEQLAKDVSSINDRMEAFMERIGKRDRDLSTVIETVRGNSESIKLLQQKNDGLAEKVWKAK